MYLQQSLSRHWHSSQCAFFSLTVSRMKLYIGNLSYQTKDSDLESLFAAHGEVVSARVMIDKQTGRSRGFGFVEMASDDAGSSAVTACNQMNFMGRTITVNEARPQEQRAPRSGGFSRGGGGGGGRGGDRGGYGGGGGNRRDDY